ncbi:hypothetical protein BRARA_E02468 [Brassica rapa]|uniref:Uncharacterized protein n=1 Tax=Brassica campestris TaxID=3711 RepID=A0A397ZLW1_BRACM|nr:hypothetical protein BRARA_E02468 [Brassica rapa]RID63463.1 hypothetical protein BRARA_E02468 [Brassica rapa]
MLFLLHIKIALAFDFNVTVLGYQLIRIPSIGSGTYKFVDLFEDVGTAVFVD